MYYMHSVKDTFKMPPEYFDKDIEKVASEMLKKKYEGSIDKSAWGNSRNIQRKEHKRRHDIRRRSINPP